MGPPFDCAQGRQHDELGDFRKVVKENEDTGKAKAPAFRQRKRRTQPFASGQGRKPRKGGRYETVVGRAERADVAPDLQKVTTTENERARRLPSARKNGGRDPSPLLRAGNRGEAAASKATRVI